MGRRGGKFHRTAISVEEMVDLYVKKQMSLREIGLQAGISKWGVALRLKKIGCNRRRRGWANHISHLSLRKPDALINIVFSRSKKLAFYKNQKWELSKRDWLKLAQSPCHYCGTTESNTFICRNRITDNIFRYNGIDRKDNRQGYTLENSLPCCAICNGAKTDLNYDLFLEWLAKVVDFRKNL